MAWLFFLSCSAFLTLLIHHRHKSTSPLCPENQRKQLAGSGFPRDFLLPGAAVRLIPILKIPPRCSTLVLSRCGSIFRNKEVGRRMALSSVLNSLWQLACRFLPTSGLDKYLLLSWEAETESSKGECLLGGCD